MPVTVLGESEASSRYYSFGTGSCSPTLRTLGPRRSQIQGPAGHSATCLDPLAPDCCAMWVRICTLAFGTVVSGVEDFASLLGGDRGFERSVARRQSFRGASLLLSVAAFLELPGGVTNVYRGDRGRNPSLCDVPGWGPGCVRDAPGVPQVGTAMRS